ncbi:hypothetical protein [Clostridium pasteurianum]|nr:hypothetical protein [Clostridium pasteurianum]
MKIAEQLGISDGTVRGWKKKMNGIRS